ncbi:RHS repeat-associated core domain-containing protein [Rhodobacteraceae bacterium 63075]|nr:RHS repeat-associated core domain-containing protein [Rhodobacteraceae bacterium 63075]
MIAKTVSTGCAFRWQSKLTSRRERRCRAISVKLRKRQALVWRWFKSSWRKPYSLVFDVGRLSPMLNDLQIAFFFEASKPDRSRKCGGSVHYPHDLVRLSFSNGSTAPEVSYLYRNALGSVVGITDANGNRDVRNHYQPFGELTAHNYNATFAAEDKRETKGFIGERFDAGAGLQYLNARYYDPVTGLFLQPDWFEVTEPGVGTNRYSYSFNDPVNLMDPRGNSAENPTVADHVMDGIARGFAGLMSAIFGGEDNAAAAVEATAETAADMSGLTGVKDTIVSVTESDVKGAVKGVAEIALGKAKSLAKIGKAMFGKKGPPATADGQTGISGSRRAPLVQPRYQPVRNRPAEINGRQ